MNFCRVRQYMACICIGALFGTTVSSAPSSPEPTGTLTLSQAVAATLARNPDLAVAGYELKAGDAQITQAGLRPNPDLSLDLEDFAGSNTARGAQAMQSTLSLSQVIELGGKREHRVDVATSERELLGVEYQARALDVLAEVTRRFIDVVADQEQLAFARGATELAERTRQTIATRVEAARAPQAELSRARIALTRAQLEQRQSESALNSARRSLAALWGATEVRFDSTKADLYALPSLDSFETLRERLDRNPEFTRFASESRLRDAELRLAQSQARPDLTLGVGVRRYEATDDAALVAGFSIGLPVFNRNQGAMAEASVRRRQTNAAEQAARIRAQAALFALYQQVRVSQEQLNTLRTDALPQAQAALEQTQYGYERGRFSYLELAIAQQDLLGLRIAAINAAADYHRLLAEIERLTGEPVAASETYQELP